MSDADKKDDTTSIGGAAPAAPKPPATSAPPPQPARDRQPGDPTVESGPPPATPAPPRTGSSLQPAPAASTPDTAEDDEATIIIPRDTARPRFSLMRIRPAGHAEPVVLERNAYQVGRAPTSDVRLYSLSASREHARLLRRDDDWYLRPFERKVVLADGAPVVDEVRLVHKMRLQLGDDELLVIDRLAPVEPPAGSRTAVRATAGRRWWIALLIAAAVIAAAGVWLLSQG